MIGQDTIERIRDQIAIVELIGQTVKLQRRGRSFVGLCPFHQEKTPSFHVNEERGFYHCFGCQASGDAIKFVQELEGLDFIGAIRRLAEYAGIEIVEDVSEPERLQQKAAKRRLEELYETNAAAAAFFERMLRDHPLSHYAQAELLRRGLDPKAGDATMTAALAAFRVGYAPYGWAGLVEHLRAAGISLPAAEKVGLLAPRRSGGGYYDRFRHRLMFAVCDLQGRIIAFSGRALSIPSDQELRAAGEEPPRSTAEPAAKYVNSPESPIYRKREAVFGLYQARQSLRTQEDCLLVEGNFDVVSLHARGISHVVAPLGTAFTPEQAKQIRRYSPRVTLLFDGDSAGKRAARNARAACQEAGLFARVASLPDGSDPDDLVRARGAEAIRRITQAARGMLEHLIESTLHDASLAHTDVSARAQKIREVTHLLAEEKDPAVRAMAEQHADRIVEHLGIADARTFRALSRAVREALAGPAPAREPGKAPAAPPERARSRDQRQEIGQQILGALLDYPELLDTPEVVAAIEQVTGDAAAAIAALRQAPLGAGARNPELLLAKMPQSIHPFALARLAAPQHSRLEDAQMVLLANIKKLKGLELVRRRSEVVEELQRAARAGDFDEELELLREQMRRARERHGL